VKLARVTIDSARSPTRTTVLQSRYFVDDLVRTRNVGHCPT